VKNPASPFLILLAVLALVPLPGFAQPSPTHADHSSPGEEVPPVKTVNLRGEPVAIEFAANRRWADHDLHGKVVLMGGVPLAGTEVRILRYDAPVPMVKNSEGTYSLPPVADLMAGSFPARQTLVANTGDDGTFTVEQLAPGFYTLYLVPQEDAGAGAGEEYVAWTVELPKRRPEAPPLISAGLLEPPPDGR